MVLPEGVAAAGVIDQFDEVGGEGLAGDVADVEDGASVDGFGAEFGERHRAAIRNVPGREGDAVRILQVLLSPCGMHNHATLILLCLAAGACLSAQVRFSPDKIAVSIDGKPFTTFNTENANKPFLSPLRSASGKIVTRRFPMEMVAGESRDHLHHRGLWFSYDDVNGVKFWENDPSYTKGRIGRIVVRDAPWKDGAKHGTLTATMDWRDPEGKTLLVESREMVFAPDPKLRTIDFHITLDGRSGRDDRRHQGRRVRDPAGGELHREEGRQDCGRRRPREHGQDVGQAFELGGLQHRVDGEKLGVAIMNHPGNPNHPTYWHARDYGLFSLNPFGQNAFDPDAEERKTKLAKGQKVTFRWRVVIHSGDAETGRVADLYKAFAAQK